jgi:hypothetical protein
MKRMIRRFSLLAVQVQRYLPVLMMAFTVSSAIFGIKTLDSEGGTGH